MQSLRKIFQWILVESRKPLVQGLIIIQLDYGNALMASINEELLTKLQVLQNTATRLVLNLPSRSPSAPSLKALHWFPIRKRIRFKIMCLAHKNMYGNRPSYLAKKINWYLPNRNLRSGTKHLLAPLRIHTSRNGGRSFSHLAPVFWNELPLQLRMVIDHNQFRPLFSCQRLSLPSLVFAIALRPLGDMCA